MTLVSCYSNKRTMKSLLTLLNDIEIPLYSNKNNKCSFGQQAVCWHPEVQDGLPILREARRLHLDQ